MVAYEFEYRHRFWMIALVYVQAYSLYNLDHIRCGTEYSRIVYSVRIKLPRRRVPDLHQSLVEVV